VGGIYDPDGINITQLDAYLNEEKKAGRTPKVSGFNGAREITNSGLLGLATEILIPGATENQITAENANNIKAKLIVEAANGPTTPDADKILAQKGIIVVPDILANAGGVVVSYFEWLQNITTEVWTLVAVEKMLQERMRKATELILNVSREYKVSLREAANICAVTRIADAAILKNNNLMKTLKGKQPYLDAGSLFRAPDTLEELNGILKKNMFSVLIEKTHDAQRKEIENISRLASQKMLTKDEKIPFYILASGPTASYKQTFSWQLAEYFHKLSYMKFNNVMLANFDFLMSTGRDKKFIGEVSKDDIVIGEGDHVLSDNFLSQIPVSNRFNIFVNTAPSMALLNNRVLTSSDIRLIRELLDQEKRFGRSPLSVIRDWPRQRSIQMQQIYPSWINADYTFNSYLPYELPVLKYLLGQKLSFALKESMESHDLVSQRIILRLFDILEGVPSVSLKGLPDDSLLLQVLGGKWMYEEPVKF